MQTRKTALAALALLSPILAGGAKRPNIIFFLVDDYGWPESSVAYGEEVYPRNRQFHTPNMERLAEKGVILTQAYACPVSTPTRTSLMSGMNAVHSHITNWTSMAKDEPSDAVGGKNGAAVYEELDTDVFRRPEWNINGLCPEGELKMLRVIRRIRESVPALVRATFLGAHAVGRGYTKEAYVREMIDLMPRAAELADFVDVFCDTGFFTPEDTARILEAGVRSGLRPKIHANELGVSGGVQVGVAHGALSVDHLEQTTDAEIDVLKGTETMPTMLPGSSFFLGIPFGRAKEFIEAGLGIALASDYNPGSSPMGDMRFVMALACIKMRLTPVQALNALTLNGAYAMGISDVTGSITPGKRADLILTRPGWTLTKVPYTYQTPWIRTVFQKGRS